MVLLGDIISWCTLNVVGKPAKFYHVDCSPNLFFSLHDSGASAESFGGEYLQSIAGVTQKFSGLGADILVGCSSKF